MSVIATFDQVCKSYDGLSQVVDHLDLAVQEGEFLSLLGPSGSGKTTTLMMLAGFETPTSGDIRLAGRSLRAVPAYKRDIGMVFQNYALFPHMTVGENVAFPLQVRNVGRDEQARRVKLALDMVQLSHAAQRLPAQLSGGQQQRVAVARALVFEPKLVLMDEPLGALDKNLREQMQFEIRQLHRRLGVTMVYVTHDQAEALTMSDRIAVFHQGKIQQLCGPREMYEQPSSAFVATFVGESNRLSGTVEALVDGVAVLRTEGGSLLQAVAGNGLRVGGEGVFTLRPERAELSTSRSAEGVGVAATLEEAIFVGDKMRARLRTSDGHEMIACRSPDQFDTLPTPGSRLCVTWRIEHARIFVAP